MKKMIKIFIAVFAAAICFFLVFLILFFKPAHLPNDKIEKNKKNIPSCIDAPAISIELGYPHVGGNVAEFTTNGSDLYVTARKFEHGGVMDPQKWLVDVYVGQINKLPIWDQQRDIVSNTTSKITFEEGEYGKFHLNVGRYWLWSGGNDILIISCDPNGVSDPKPVK